MPLNSGEHFAGYRILGMLGSGGMGEVYLAQHPRLPRRDALKVLPRALSADPEYRERFNREADLAAGLFHPHIVGIHDRGEFDEQLWISMDYIDGTDVGRHLHRHFKSGLPLADVVEIVTAIADALDYAHASGLLHRDVKPGNILLTRPATGRRRILLADFGIARALSDTGDLTKLGTAVGTANYCSPEQLTGKAMDGRADQYALATTAFQLITGFAPFDDPNSAVVIGHQLSMPPPSIGSPERPELAQLDPVFATGMAKDPARRYPRCTDFALAMAAHMPADRGSQVPVAPNPKPPTAVLPVPLPARVPTFSPPPMAPAAPRNHGWVTPFAVGGLIGLVLVIGIVLTQRGGDGPGHGSTAGSNAPTSAVTTMDPTSTTPAVNFDSMSDLVTTYYGQLPGNPGAAWSMLTPEYQEQTGQVSYLDFWGSVDSVTVQSVSPRSDTSVVARLTYVINGRSQSENRWLSAELVDGELMISGSQIGG
ncbi:MAG: serine/threonine-protein kinase [Mycobacterium sp.]